MVCAARKHMSPAQKHVSYRSGAANYVVKRLHGQTNYPNCRRKNKHKYICTSTNLYLYLIMRNILVSTLLDSII